MTATFDALRRNLHRLSTSRRLRLAAAWLAGLLVLYTLLGFFALPYFGKPRLESALAEALQRPVAIESLYTNPFSLSTRLQGLQVQSPDGSQTVLSLDEAYANVSISSLLRRAPVVDRLRLVGPYVHLVRHADGQYNFQDLIDRYMWQEPQEPAEPARYAVHNIDLIGGRVEFDDQRTGQMHTIHDLELGVPFFSSLPHDAEVLVQPRLSAVVNGAPFAVHGETKPFGEVRESTLQLQLDGIALPPYLDYSPIPLRFEMAAGTLDLRLQLRFVSRANTLETLSLNGAAQLHDLSLRQRDGEPLLGARTIDAVLEDLDLVHNRLRLSQLRIAEPQLQLTRFRGGNLNLELLLPLDTGQPESPPASATEESTKPPFSYALQTLELRDGEIKVLDYAAPRQFSTTLSQLSIDGQNLGNESDSAGRLAIAFDTVDQGRVQQEGELRLTPLAGSGRITLHNLPLTPFAPYLPLEGEIAGGRLDAQSEYSFRQGKDGMDVKLSELQATLRDARIDTPQGQGRTQAARLELSGGHLDVAARRLNIGAIDAQALAIALRRSPDGVLDIGGLLRTGQSAGTDTAETAPAASEPAWQYLVQRLSLNDASLLYEDESVRQPAQRGGRARGKPAEAQPLSIRATALNASLTQLTNASAQDQPSQLKVEAAINEQGRIKLEGPLRLAPFSGDLQVQAEDIGIRAFQPYWRDAVQVEVTRGTLSTRGQLRIQPIETGPVQLRYRGGASIDNFASVDQRTNRDLLRWKRLALRQGQIQTAPLRIDVGALSLNDFYSRIVVRSDGSLNVQHLLAEQEVDAGAAQADPEKAEPSSGSKPYIQIGDITLRSGHLNFSDFYIKPNYSAEIAGLSGSISAITPEQAGQLRLQGEINESAPVTIAGEINPLAENLYLNLQAEAREVNLPPLSPYSVRYIGYPIERGKLSMEVQYHIEQGELSADNRLILNQLTFGDRVESPEAIELPIHLAVSLLKNRDGVIDLNVPISGSLDDPQFSIGAVIARAFVNVLVKAVTSPFALIGSLFGGDGETLSYLEFEPGSASLDEANIDKLRTMATALRNRPQLQLDIIGRVAPDLEAQAVKEDMLLRRMKAQKLKDLARTADTPPSLESIEIAPQEYEKYLRRVYRAADFDKPRNVIGLTRSLPPGEMHRLLLEHLEPNENALRRLANARAQAAYDWLTEEGQVPAEQIYIIAPKLSSEGIEDDGAATRVDFSLR